MDGNIRSKRALGCRQCGGVWLGQEDMEALLRESPDDLDAADRRFPNLVGHGWDLVSERRCPMCGETLESYTTEVPARVSLDRCPNGHGLWFDDGELSALAWAARRAGNEA
jgi:Zn-finger nucleic acid-binding protein